MERTIDYEGKKVAGTEVRFDTIREEWNVYELKDGSTIKAKLVVTAILRLNGEFNAEGDPMYIIKSTNLVTSVDVPEHLRKNNPAS